MKKLLFLIPILLIGCKPCERLAKKCPPHIKDSISYIETISEDYIIPDSAYWSLLFWCDSSNNVLLRELDEYNTGMNTEITIKEVIKFKDKIEYKYLKVDISAFTDSIMVLNRMVEKYKNQYEYIDVEVPVKYVPKFYKYTLIFSIFVLLGIVAYIWIRLQKPKLIK